ncbi:MAG: MarR family transcriptional regulator [Rikenellaceae bacterium]|nr:MarR family transcriptional regulator [Rikenellaceae bacterium]
MEDKILKALEQGGAMKPGDIAVAAGENKDDVAKAIKKLVADGKVYSPKRCFYDIKK